MYTKLFIGMGFIWTFEIISGLTQHKTGESAWWFTDVLNMLQGFYIFAIFICKRTVFNVVFNIKDNNAERGSARANSTSSIRHSIRFEFLDIDIFTG